MDTEGYIDNLAELARTPGLRVLIRMYSSHGRVTCGRLGAAA